MFQGTLPCPTSTMSGDVPPMSWVLIHWLYTLSGMASWTMYTFGCVSRYRCAITLSASRTLASSCQWPMRSVMEPIGASFVR